MWLRNSNASLPMIIHIRLRSRQTRYANVMPIFLCAIYEGASAALLNLVKIPGKAIK